MSSDEFFLRRRARRQKEVEARLLALGDELAKKQGMSAPRVLSDRSRHGPGLRGDERDLGTIFDASRAEAATTRNGGERPKGT